MNDSKKICFICGGKYKAGGVSVAIMNLLRNNPSYQVDIIAPVEETFDMFISELKLDKRVNLICLNQTFDKGNRRQFSNELLEYLKKHKYFCGVVHSGLISFQLTCLSALKKSGITNRVAYSHSKGISKKNAGKFIQNILRFQVCRLATHYMAVTEDAAKWLFGDKKLKKVIIIPNGINSSRFIFNRQDRDDFRANLRVKPDLFLMGCFGRISFEKNQQFLLPILKKINHEKMGILFIGDGSKANLEKYVVDNQLSNVYFMDSLKDIEKAFSAVDLLLVPSKFEGLGMVAIEAQCNGLQVVCSDGVPTIVDFNRCEFIPLEERKWVNGINSKFSRFDSNDRKLFSNKIINAVSASQFSETASSLMFWNEIEKIVEEAEISES
ncbi:glycosyltransferase [Enterococcus faecium]|nr:glycosyltransferase [Enterococcus faecium]